MEKCDLLQDAVDRIFNTNSSGAALLGLSFSVTIADPQVEGCPLIGCSTGFTTMCGYEVDDIVGHNCRFLVDPVPAEYIDKRTRHRCRDFCLAAKDGTQFKVPSDEQDAWLPQNRPSNELIAAQKNARKDGSLFDSLFLMRIIGLGDFDNERYYIIALQSELPGGKADLPVLCNHLHQLDKNMAKVERVLSQDFIISGCMYRQDVDIDEEQPSLADLEAADKVCKGLHMEDPHAEIA